MARTREEELKEVPPWTANKEKWPLGVRAIGMEEMDCLGVDRHGNLYWDGKPVEVRRFSLTGWQAFAATVIAGFAAAGAFGTFLVNLIRLLLGK